MNISFTDALKIVAAFTIWGIAILIGVITFVTLADIVMAFASTGIGAVVLVFVVWRFWKNYNTPKDE